MLCTCHRRIPLIFEDKFRELVFSDSPRTSALQRGTPLSTAKSCPILRRDILETVHVLFTNRKSHIRALDWYRKWWSWMTLNRVMVVILRHFTRSSIVFGADYVKQTEVRPTVSAMKMYPEDSSSWHDMIHDRERAFLSWRFCQTDLLPSFHYSSCALTVYTHTFRLSLPDFAEVKQCDIWPQFSLVAFKSPSFRNGTTYRKSKKELVSADDLVSYSDYSTMSERKCREGPLKK